MNANNFLVLISGDIVGDVDMCSVFGLISSILFSCLPAGSSWRWYDLRWRVNKAVSDLRGVEPAVLLSVKLKGKTAGGGVNLAGTSGTSTLIMLGLCSSDACMQPTDALALLFGSAFD